jgi:pyruvate dehydrogenase E2 component (dihydrolipoamide acetyltransferase)
VDVELTFTDLLVKLVAAALRAHPEVNVRWEDGRVRRLPDVNVGIAVATDHGLVVPVVHRADTLPVEAIARRRAELVDRARAGKLRPEDVEGGTFTVSNLGMYGVDRFLAVVNAPQAAILSVGRVVDRVVVDDGRPAVRPSLTLGLSCDHRALDGARAARFLETLAAWVEEPLALLH